VGCVWLAALRLRYPWLEKPLVVDGIYLADIADIAAMKLAALTNRGSKKDFFDLYILLQEYQLDELLQFYRRKFPDGSTFLVLKSLAYFDDAEDEPTPVMLIATSWQQVKSCISKALQNI